MEHNIFMDIFNLSAYSAGETRKRRENMHQAPPYVLYGQRCTSSSAHLTAVHNRVILLLATHLDRKQKMHSMYLGGPGYYKVYSSSTH